MCVSCFSIPQDASRPWPTRKVCVYLIADTNFGEFATGGKNCLLFSLLVQVSEVYSKTKEVLMLAIWHSKVSTSN